MHGLRSFSYVLLFFCLPLCGQQAYPLQVGDPVNDPWRWTHFEQLDGEQVRTITQGADGAMLFGVESGILRYDGYTYARWDKPAALKDRTITSVVQTAADSTVVGTDDGLFRVGPAGWQPLLSAPDRMCLNVYDLLRLPDGSLVVGLAEKPGRPSLAGLLHFQGGQTTLYASRETARLLEGAGGIAGVAVVVVPDRVTITNDTGARVFSVRDLAVRRNGELLVALSGPTQLGKLVVMDYTDDGRQLAVVRSYGEKDGLRIRSKVSMAEAADGELWVVSNAYELGIYRFDGKAWRSEKLSDRFGGVDSQSNLLIGSDGSVWVDGHGRLFRYRAGEWAEFKNPDIPITTVSRFILYEDQDRQLWIAGRLSQVYRFDRTYATWATYEGLNFQVQTGGGRRWYLTVDGRAVVEQDDKWLAYGREEGMIDTPVRIIATAYGEVWVSGSHRGVAAVAYFDGRRWQAREFASVSWGFDPRAAFEDRDGGLWFGCNTDFERDPRFRGGVIHFPTPRTDKTHFEHLAAGPEVRVTTSYGIGQSSDGRIWVGGKPLWTYDGNEWRIFDSLPAVADYVDFVETAPNGDLWLASRFHGLIRHTGRQWTRYTIKDGLGSNNTLNLQALAGDKVWATTYGGYSFFDGSSWSSGLFPLSLTESREGAGVQEDAEGQLWFNHTPLDWKRRELFTTEAAPRQPDFTSYRTVRYRNDNLPPQTYLLTEVEEVEPATDFTIFWAGTDRLNATGAEDLRFAWRLNGSEWSDYSTVGYARFGQLPPGEYVLDVRARDRDNQVDPSPASLSFTVLPIWWKRWEFVLLVLVALAGLLTLQFRILSRNRRLSVLNHKLERQSAELHDRGAEVARQRDRLRQTVQEVKELSQSQLRFFTNVSHEFRTPLSLIIGPVEELLRNSPEPSGGRLKRYHRIVLRSANRILQLIEQILHIYKVEETTLAFDPSPGNLARQCGEIIELFQPLARKSGVELLSSSLRELPARFDADKVEKILFNLLSNAFKNVPAGGRIEVGLVADPANDSLQLSVRDNGRGIPPDKLDRIFERFYHTTPDDNSPFRTGLGIGLAYIKELVKTHRGDIVVTSEPGVATIFTVTLPWLRVANQLPAIAVGEVLSPTIHQAVSLLDRSMRVSPAPEPHETVAGDAPVKLLVVEDDEDTRNFLRDCFSSTYEVIEAADGQRGLELAQREAPDLILADVSMPVMDGFALCRRLKADFDTSHIPVILLTARTAERDKITGFETGADAYVEKPFSWQLLRSRVGGLIRQRDRLRQRFREGKAADATDLPEVHSVDERFMQQLLERVEHHLDNAGLDAEALAHEVGVSRIQLYRKLKALSGQTVSQFIRAVRLRRAAELLQAGELTVAEVAYRTGFTAPNHFSTYFRKKYGVPPSQYAASRESSGEP